MKDGVARSVPETSACYKSLAVSLGADESSRVGGSGGGGGEERRVTRKFERKMGTKDNLRGDCVFVHHHVAS